MNTKTNKKHPELERLLRIIKLRTGKTQDEVARDLGLTRPTISNQLNMHTPADETIARIRIVYKSELADDETPPTNSITKAEAIATVTLHFVCELLAAKQGRSVHAVVREAEDLVSRALSENIPETAMN